MAKTKKRILSLAMVLVMVFTLLPVSALAVGGTGIECTKAEDCPAETHVEGCPKYVAPDENNDEDLNKDPEDQNAEVPEAVQAVENLIKALPEYADVGPDDLADIEAADQAYQALSPEEKAAVDPDLAELLTDLMDLAEEIREILEDDTETPDRVTYGEVDRTDWTELTVDGGSLTAEKYYLTDNVTLTTNLTVPADAKVTLDLNGFTLRGKGSGSVITVLGELTLENTSDNATGTITGGMVYHAYYGPGKVVYGYGGGVRTDEGGVFNMNGGTIKGNRAEDSGGGVYVGKDSTFNMNGGTISGNKAGNGGGVRTDEGGVFNMNGGTISGNYATSDGGGVYNKGTFNMAGGSIVGNTAYEDGGGVGNFGTFTMTDGTIGGTEAGAANKANGAASSDGGGVYNFRTFIMSGGTIIGNEARQYGGGVDSHTYSKFTMTGGTITGNVASMGGGVHNFGGTFTMSDGTITGNEASQFGGGVHNRGMSNGSGVWYREYGTFTMTGGSITDNIAPNWGGGVSNEGCTCTMEGGIISGNKGGQGGGVYSTGQYDGPKGSFTMTGGSITENEATNIGGGVYASNTFTMTGGSITGNTATNNGGGVYNGGNTFTMSGGSITGNTATNNGGGVHNLSTFTMTSGSITGNTATNNGGGVYNLSTFNMTSGSITDNTATSDGGGVYNGGTFTMKVDPENTSEIPAITDNTATNNGGGVYNSASYYTFTMSDGKLCNNTAMTAGDDVCIEDNQIRNSSAKLPAINAAGWTLDKDHGGIAPNGSTITGWFYDGMGDQDEGGSTISTRWNVDGYIKQFIPPTNATFKGPIALKAAYGVNRVSIQYYLDDAPLDTPPENAPSEAFVPEGDDLPDTKQGLQDLTGVTDEVTVDDIHYVLDKIETGTDDNDNPVIKVYYAKDVLVDHNEEPDSSKSNDGIPDKYQVVVNYVSNNTSYGTVSKSTEVLTLKDGSDYVTEGTVNATVNASTTSLSRVYFSSWTITGTKFVDGAVTTNQTLASDIQAVGGQTYTITANFGRSSSSGNGGGGKGGTTTIKDPEVPLAGGLELNKQDHFAYIRGYADGTVRPNNYITRAQVATIFYRLMTDETRMLCYSDTNDFSDVPADYWANKAISTLSNAGIITGFSDGTFRPNAFITRAQFAAIAARFSVVTEDLPNPFSDVPEGYWAEDLIAFAAHLGWVNGYPDGTFRPTANITRAAAMKLINNVLERQVDEDGLLEDATQWSDCTTDDWCYYIVMEATNSHDWERRSSKSLVEDWTALTADPVWDE